MTVKKVIEQVEHLFGRQSEQYMFQLINDALLDIGSTKQHLLEQAVIYRAAADCARFLLQDDQDEEIYIPMIKDLTNQFANSLKLFLSKFGKESPVSQQAVSKKDQLSKMLGG